MFDGLNSKKKQSVEYGCIWVFLCCYFMQLFNFPNVITIMIGGLLCLLFVIRQSKFRLDAGTILLTITLASYFIILYGVRAFSMSLPYVGILIYVLGNYLTCQIMEDEKPEKKMIWLLFAIVIGYLLHGVINSFLFLDGQIQGKNVRVWMDIWEAWYLPGTWQVIFYLPAFAMIFPIFIYFRKRKFVNIIYVMATGLFLYVALASKTRTPILAFPIVFFAQAVLYVILERKKCFAIAKSRKFYLGAMVVIVVLLAVVFAFKDHPLITSFVSIMGRDGGVLNNVRFKIHRAGLKQLFVYPMGGYQMDFLGHAHAHNTWIDVADAAGIIPFFSFAFFEKNNSNNILYLVLSFSYGTAENNSSVISAARFSVNCFISLTSICSDTL